VSARAVRLLLAGALALGATAALGALSWVPYTAERVDHGVIRLAWRARGERVRQCRRLTPEELARQPRHMRQEEVCERRILPYRLRVSVDGTSMVDREIRAGGAREDRPLFVFHELVVAPGTHTLRVTFERQDGFEQPGQDPPRLTLDRTVKLAARGIVLVTNDDERRMLIVVGGN